MVFILMGIFFFIHCSLSGSEIEGKVIDVQTGEELVGATIYIHELKQGTMTDLNGFFKIMNIPDGNYIISCNYIGYKKEEKKVSIKRKEILKIDFQLKPVSLEIEEITVTGKTNKETEIGAKITENKSTQLVNIVSAKTIELSPDINVASVIQRVSGITLDKSSTGTGQYALLRGMDKRYNYTLINGIKIPSTNNKHRYVSLDLFPSDMVERVEVIKSITPNFEGDAIGGVVNMIMRNAPEKILIQGNVSVGVSEYFIKKPFYTFNALVLNPKSPYERYGNSYYATPNDFNTKNLVIYTVKRPVNHTGNITIGNRFFDKRLGVIISGSYQKTYTGENSLYFSDDLTRDGKNLPLLKDMQERFYYEDKENFGVHSKLDYVINPNHQLKIYYAIVGMKRSQLREMQKTDLTVSYDPLNGNINRSHSTRFRYNFQQLSTLTLQGEHNIGNNFSLSWSLVSSIALNKTPEEAQITYGNSLNNYTIVNQYVDFDGSSRIWRRNSDEDLSAYVDFSYDIKELIHSSKIHFGGMVRNKDRTSFYNKYTLKAISYVTEDDSTYLTFYSEKGKDWHSYDEIQWQVYNPKGTIAVGENYNAFERMYAGYLMYVFDDKKIKATGGLRIEYNLQGYSMKYPIGEPEPSDMKSYTEFLPAINLKYLINNFHHLRFSYFKAINKPGFQEIVPYIDSSEEPYSSGNKNLKHATANNIDLRYEYFPEGLDQFMVGFFYKNIKNPIEYAFEKHMNLSQIIVFRPVNSNRAINYGFEVDLVKYFNNWGIRGNYTKTRSRISTNKLARVKDNQGNDSTAYILQTRPLYGQAENVINISFIYKGDKRGINAQISFTYTGDRIYSVSRYIDNDHWQKGTWQLDFSGEKNFKHLSIFFKANNLLNTHTNVHIKKTNPLNADVPYHSEFDKTTLVRDEYSRPTYLIGIRYKY